MESEWAPTTGGGIADLDNITATEFLQQMYYMCQNHATQKGVSPEQLGSAISFTGMEGEPLVMMLVPYLSTDTMMEEDGPSCLN